MTNKGFLNPPATAYGTGGGIVEVTWDDILDKPDYFSPSAHVHTIDQIEGLATKVTELTIGIQNNSEAIDTVASQKVDKVTGKGLSTNDFTNALKDKLDSLSVDSSNIEEQLAPLHDAILELEEEFEDHKDNNNRHWTEADRQRYTELLQEVADLESLFNANQDTFTKNMKARVGIPTNAVALRNTIILNEGDSIGNFPNGTIVLIRQAPESGE